MICVDFYFHATSLLSWIGSKNAVNPFDRNFPSFENVLGFCYLRI